MSGDAAPTKEEALEDAPDLDLGALQRQLARGHGTFDLRLKKIIGYGGVSALVVQLLAGNAVFVLYAAHNAWHIPAVAISAWLTACVVQVAVIVRTITAYIFPHGSKPTGTDVA